MRSALAVAGVLAAAVAVPALASGGRVAMRCAQQSSATFDGAFRDRGNLVVGPFAWLGARRDNVDGSYDGTNRWKQPVLVRPGHTVTLRIGASARNFAGLAYDHDGGWSFSGSERTVVFSACPAGKASSRSNGRPVTFWSGGVVSKQASICLPVELRIDNGPVRHHTIRLGEKALCRQGA